MKKFKSFDRNIKTYKHPKNERQVIMSHFRQKNYNENLLFVILVPSRLFHHTVYTIIEMWGRTLYCFYVDVYVCLLTQNKLILIYRHRNIYTHREKWIASQANTQEKTIHLIFVNKINEISFILKWKTIQFSVRLWNSRVTNETEIGVVGWELYIKYNKYIS